MRVVIDTDPGTGVAGADVDDGLAIGLALRSPELEVEAVTVVAGNVPVERGVAGTLEILDAAGRSDVPVHRGAGRPLVQDPAAWRAHLDGRRDDDAVRRLWHGIGPVGSALRARPTTAARALVELVDAAPGELTVVALGPLTNLAQAMLLDPAWAEKVAGLVVMGGAFDVPGVLREQNAAYDPEATHVVLSSAAPLRIVPLDVTLRTLMTPADVDRLDRAADDLARYLARTVRPWVAWSAERSGRGGCPLHDPLTVATLLDPGLVTTRTAAVGIELRGSLTRGRTVAWDPSDDVPRADLALPEVHPATVATGVDGDRLVALLLDRLCG
ncbi:nucleoside hydrolase [Puerhibacterium sp. TATVAM-FAB25]|uniref:nucleoside hydrolase n=1 Tax=Puerhibacterium sp. TATVAM-FAB25 TaxID=3093699 RepID=UPI0039785A4E